MNLDFSRCSISGSDLWIGLPPHPDHGREAIRSLPEAPKSVLFVEGPEQGDLIADFVRSSLANVVENLMIGTSHDYIGDDHPTPYDFSGAMAALKGANLPALKRLGLGDMELLFNGHGYYGSLGDITHVFDIAPQLEELRICGSAQLSNPVHHDRLVRLHVTVDDVAGHCGPWSETSFTNLLTSRFARLAECDLSLEAEGASQYRIPETFFTGEGWPALDAVSIDCLAPEDEIRLSAWKASNGLRW